MPVILEIINSIIIVLLLQVGTIYLIKFFIKRNELYKKKLNSLLDLPHPPSFPLVGNLLQLRNKPLDKLNEWSKKYGPIYGVYLGQKYFVVLNNHEVVNDLIVKCGSKYSSRYNFNNLNSVLVKSNSIALAPYGDKWKRDRSVAYSALTSRSIIPYYSYIYNDSDILIKDLMKKHGQTIYPLQIIKKFVLTNMLNILFGSYDDLFFNDVMKVMDDITEFSSFTTVLNDFIPVLDYVYKPSTDKAERVYKDMEKIFSSKYDQFLKDYSQDKKLSPSFLLQIQEAISEKENSSIEYEDVWGMLVNLLNGAMETEVNTLMWMIACLANNPGVQEEAFKELDTVCEGSRPSIRDEINLPYVSSIINETLRYRPPSAFGFVHLGNEDGEYNGYLVPKDTPLIINLFAINHNERRFIAPEKFRPSRFMQQFSTGSVKSKSILLPQLDFDSGIEDEMNKKRSSLIGLLKNNSPSLTNSSMPMHMSFGAGRRYCIGQHLAQKQLFLAISYILWAFEIKPGVGKDGTALDINVDSGKLSLTSFSPHPYKVRFLLRKDIGLLI